VAGINPHPVALAAAADDVLALVLPLEEVGPLQVGVFPFVHLGVIDGLVPDVLVGHLLQLDLGLVLGHVLFYHLDGVVVLDLPGYRHLFDPFLLLVVGDDPRAGNPLNPFPDLVLDHLAFVGNILDPALGPGGLYKGLILDHPSAVAGRTGLAGRRAGGAIPFLLNHIFVY
jgi:hypothetical protein